MWKGTRWLKSQASKKASGEIDVWGSSRIIEEKGSTEGRSVEV